MQIWDLLDAFSRLMESIGQADRKHEVIYDDTPIELYAEDLRDRLLREGPLTFRQVFEGRTARVEVVGLFLAMLELIRRRQIIAAQNANFGEIRLQANPDAPPDDTETAAAEGSYLTEPAEAPDDAGDRPGDPDAEDNDHPEPPAAPAP